MALTIQWNTNTKSLTYIYRATGGGATFSSNLAGTTGWDLFDDSPQVNDAVYFGINTNFWLDLYLEIATALAGTNVVLKWEYWNAYAGDWKEIPNQQDDTSGLTTSGIFRFGCPEDWGYTTVNGSGAMWIRVRLDSFDSISEGGAIGSTEPYGYDGYLRVSGTTEDEPATFQDVADWVETNLSYMGSVKTGYNLYDLSKFGLYINSPLKSTLETIIMGHMKHYNGNIAQRGPRYYCYYLRAGELTDGDSATRYGSEFVIYGRSWGITPLIVDWHTKMYNSKIRAGKWENGYENSLHVGYPSLGQAELIDCIFEGIAPNMSNSGVGTWKNVTIRKDTFLMNGFPVTFEGVKVIVTGSLFFLYNNSATARDFDYVFDSGKAQRLFLFYNSWHNIVINFINPKKPLPSIFDDVPSTFRSGAPYPNQFPHGSNTFLKVFYYDSVNGTYTDYTTEASDESAGDVPLYGNEGDCWYLQVKDTAGWKILGIRVDAVVPDGQENDYEYVWEEHRNGDWIEYRKVWDLSESFTQNKPVYLQRNTGNYYLDKITVNGVTGYWIRFRITKKGTKTPVLKKMVSHGEGGIADNHIYEKYEMDINVTDEQGQPIEGARVVVVNKDKNNEVVTDTTTDATGSIETQTLIRTDVGFSPLDSYDNPYQLREEITENYRIYVYKTGFQRGVLDVVLNEKKNIKIALKKAKVETDSEVMA